MLPPPLARDAQHATTALAHTIPHQTAAAWVHTTALARHATALGLIHDHGRTVDTIKALADSHPALAGLVDPAVNPAFTVPAPDLENVEKLLAAHPAVANPRRPDSHILGDLYQTISVESRKGRALCQTPPFVTNLLLDLAAEPAIRQWDADLRIIDPACGTGHILVETFIRLYAHTPRGSLTDHIDTALAAVHGVDLDPYAALIARYRLLALWCRMGGRRLTAGDAPGDLPVNVAAANSLLDDHPLLAPGRYHVVLGNPPYITVKDPQVNAAVRARYPRVCSRKYSLALPFFQLMTDLLVPGGWCAQLTANSFMKREFGRRFVEDYLPSLDLRWVIDTSGAYIPGHGTPTVILVHRNQPPSDDEVAVIQGVRGEPSTPADPARGVVWRAIEDAVRRKLSYQRFAEGVRAAQDAAAGVAGHGPASLPTLVEAPARVGQLDLFDLLGVV